MYDGCAFIQIINSEEFIIYLMLLHTHTDVHYIQLGVQHSILSGVRGSYVVHLEQTGLRVGLKDPTLAVVESSGKMIKYCNVCNDCKEEVFIVYLTYTSSL